MTRRLFAVLLALALAVPRAGAVAYHDVIPGARGMGMGHAFSAIADDAYAMFYNPAGTANMAYTQAGGTMGRMLSPKGPLFFSAATYLRPYEPINTATIGVAYYLERQRNGGDIDSLMFNYGQEFKPRAIPLSKPLKVGANVKIVNSDPGDGNKSKFGLGFDAGVIARSNTGLSAGFVLSDMVSALSYPRPALTLALAYSWLRRFTIAGDFRVRGGLAEFYPGAEATFHQGLLRVRGGKGLNLDGVSTACFGLGVNFSPVILDVAVSLPTAGLNRYGGAYQASFTYRFGAPSFAGQFVGQAASRAEALRADLAVLEEKHKTLSQQAGTAEKNKTVTENELRVLEKRVREVQDQYRALLKRNDEVEYRTAEKAAVLEGRPSVIPKKPRPKPAPPAWPKRHPVKTGETLRSIARQHYGDPNLWERIYDRNRGKVERGLPIEGATLIIPAPN
ncbi:MAG: hypothetical protein HYZ74_06200 [Elusimicrobia bacterium]|nr:hypothetical protein [Elusimicrobiota bacterium]